MLQGLSIVGYTYIVVTVISYRTFRIESKSVCLENGARGYGPEIIYIKENYGKCNQPVILEI